MSSHRHGVNAAYHRWRAQVYALQLAHTLALLLELYATERLSEHGRTLVWHEASALTDALTMLSDRDEKGKAA